MIQSQSKLLINQVQEAQDQLELQEVLQEVLQVLLQEVLQVLPALLPEPEKKITIMKTIIDIIAKNLKLCNSFYISYLL